VAGGPVYFYTEVSVLKLAYFQKLQLRSLCNQLSEIMKEEVRFVWVLFDRSGITFVSEFHENRSGSDTL
jgi:hypothetical protein